MRAAFRIGLVGLALGTMITGGAVAHAGDTHLEPVVISDFGTSGMARGSVRDTRNTADLTAQIYCASNVSQFGQSIFCAATSTNGDFRMCTLSGGPALTYSLVLASVSDSSHIQFAWDGTGACTDIRVMNGSWLLR